MHISQRERLQSLLRRVDEVRGLADPADAPVATDPDDATALIRTVAELVEDLERSHRRLIETNVQLVSLREVASSIVTAADHAETTRTITRYLTRVLDYEDAFLLLLDRERGVLEGTWTHRGRERELGGWCDVPLLGDRGAATRALWLNRTILLRDPQRHPPLMLADGHPLRETLGRLGSVACVPLQRSQNLAAAEPHELCGARCILGDASLLVPPPPPAADGWALERDERMRHCLGCELMPILGVVGIARGADVPALGPGDVSRLESIALSLAPVVENADLNQELRKSERFRFHVMDSMASALVAVNMKQEVLAFNRAARELLGYADAEVLGQPFGALCGSDGETLIRAALEHGRMVLREETVLRARDGAPVPVSFTTSLLRNEGGGIYGAIATFLDLTPLKRAEEHARSQDRLAALGRFTSSVAHEIRNPLTGIAAGVQYLARVLPEATPRENLDFILSEIRRLDRIVQQLFDITHPRRLQLVVAPLEDTARRAVQSLEAVLAERGVTATVRVAPMTPPLPYDSDQIQQVFINLIKNAAEASPRGGTIRIAVGPTAPSRRGARAPAPPTIEARVDDRGGGIAPEHLTTIFEPFFTTKPKGTGLGLYICHDIVRRHGGALTTHTIPGGTSFRLELPQENHGGSS